MNLTRTRAKEIRLVVGGESRVDLLPPEVAARAKVRSTRQAMIGCVVVTVLLVGAGYGYTAFNASVAADRLVAEQEMSSTLIQQQSEYIAIRQVESDLTGAHAARAVGASTEIDWEAYFKQLEATLPEGSSFANLAVETATPIDVLPATAATAAPGAVTTSVVTLTLDASSNQVIDVRSWLLSLAEVPGFVDAKPKSVTRQDDGTYLASVVMHLDSTAYWNRYAPVAADETEPNAAPASTQNED